MRSRRDRLRRSGPLMPGNCTISREVPMRSRCVLFLALAFAAVVVSPSRIHPLHAQAGDAMALTGLVSSAEEGPMEGVLVSARKINSTVPTTVTTTVVTDKEGRYRFPASRLEPGQYAL